MTPIDSVMILLLAIFGVCCVLKVAFLLLAIFGAIDAHAPDEKQKH